MSTPSFITSYQDSIDPRPVHYALRRLFPAMHSRPEEPARPAEPPSPLLTAYARSIREKPARPKYLSRFFSSQLPSHLRLMPLREQRQQQLEHVPLSVEAQRALSVGRAPNPMAEYLSRGSAAEARSTDKEVHSSPTIETYDRYGETSEDGLLSSSTETLLPQEEQERRLWPDVLTDLVQRDKPEKELVPAAHYPLPLLPTGQRPEDILKPPPVLNWYRTIVTVSTLVLATWKVVPASRNQDVTAVAGLDWIMTAGLGLPYVDAYMQRPHWLMCTCQALLDRRTAREDTLAPLAVRPKRPV